MPIIMTLLICAGPLTDCTSLDVPRTFPTAKACVAAIGGEIAKRGPAARRAECTARSGPLPANQRRANAATQLAEGDAR